MAVATAGLAAFALSSNEPEPALQPLSEVGDADAVVVIELFTSQGCSSCPPADRLLGELAQKPGILALSHHVDYWDYLGWKDPYSSSTATERQRAYAQRMNLRGLYTPQAVVDGRLETVGSRRTDVLQIIAESLRQGRPQETLMAVERGEEGFSIDVVRADDAEVFLVEYLPEAKTQVPRGENRGRTLTEHNVVTDWRSLGKIDEGGQVFFVQASKLDAQRAYAVIVQERGAGPILAAIKLNPSAATTPLETASR
ncbi:MAG: DUF1223 domain-containing protein [Opitutales bacterium]